MPVFHAKLKVPQRIHVNTVKLTLYNEVHTKELAKCVCSNEICFNIPDTLHSFPHISPTGAKNTVYYEKLLTHPSPNPAIKLFSHYNGQTVGLGEGCVGS